MKTKNVLFIAVIIASCMSALGAESVFAQQQDQYRADLLKKSTESGKETLQNAGEGRGHSNSEVQPGICPEGEGECQQDVPLGVTKEGVDKIRGFSVNSISPMSQINENMRAQAFADQITESADSALAVNFLSMAYTDPGFFSAMKDSIGASIGIAQARYQADQHFHTKANETDYGKFFNQTYEGCLQAYLSGSGGNSATTYAEAQEKCLKGKTGSLERAFETKPAGNAEEAMSFAHFLDLPRNANGTLNEEYLDSSEDGKTTIRLSSVVFNREIEAQGGLNSTEGASVVKLRKQFRGYIGDYLWKIEHKGETANGMNISTKKLAPAFPKADKGGFDAIRKAFFEQAYHSIYAIEYAHCLIANNQGSTVFPGESSETLTEANFWEIADKHSDEKGSASIVNWVTQGGKWHVYNEDDPLQLNKRTFLEHRAGLSVGSFVFDGPFESSLWSIVRNRLVPKLSEDKMNYCEQQLGSWTRDSIPQNWGEGANDANEVEGLIVYLASGIADVQIYTFLGEMLGIIGRVSSNALDQSMTNMARDMISSFVNYADGGAALNDAMMRVNTATNEIMRLAANETRDVTTETAAARRGPPKDLFGD